MKIEERYIRTYDGFIRKIKVVSKENAPLVLCVINGKPYTVDDIKKSSPNIIDLVEIGDLVKHKTYGDLCIDEVCEDDEGLYIVCIVMDIEKIYLKDLDIKSIITREQIEQVSYKVVE